MDGEPENDQQTNDVVLDIERLLEKADQLPHLSNGWWYPDHACVYRVPQNIRNNGEAFTPKLISIGPLHSHSNKLQDMTRYKVKFFREMLQKSRLSLKECVSFAGDMEAKMRQSYSENISLLKNEFIMIILIDAGFILELFWRYYFFDVQENDHFFTWLSHIIKLDLLLLENQLPFFFLEKLYEIAFCNGSRGQNPPSFKELSFYYFDYYNTHNLSQNDNICIEHFTDLIRTFYLLERGSQNYSDVSSKLMRARAIHMPSASMLAAAGLNLKAADYSLGLVDWRFTWKFKCLCYFPLPISSRALEISPLMVDDTTQVLLQNLLAYEQCHYRFEPYLTTYILMLDCLINTEHDVDILVSKKIIVNYLGESSKAIGDMLTSLGRNIVHVGFQRDYAEIVARVNEFYGNHWRSLMASWKPIVSYSAILVTILTLIQTICSIIDLAKL